MNSEKRQIEELKSRIKVLENENYMLASRAEDMMLLGLLVEIAESIPEHVEMLTQVLERISILKDITFCVCGNLHAENIIPIASYCHCTDEAPEINIGISDEIRSNLEEGSVYLEKDGLDNLLCGIIDLKSRFSIKQVLIIPFSFRLKEKAVFVFASSIDSSTNEFGKSIALLQQLVKIVEGKLNNSYLLQVLKDTNNQLEKRVNDRTRKLEQTNKNLEREIEKRLVTEKKLESSEKKFREIFQYANDAIVLWDVDEENFPNKCLEVNEAFLQLSGYSREALMQMVATDLRGEETSEETEERHRSSRGSLKANFIVPLRTKSGKDIPTEVSAHRFFMQDREVVLAIHRDITERKKYEDEILRAKIAAEESDRLKSAFLANMSHEIRTPMNAIMGFSELLQYEDITAEERKTYVNILQHKGEELLTLINDILYISKIEADQIDLNYCACNIAAFLERSKLSWENMLSKNEKSHLHLIYDLDDSCGTYLMIDEIRVGQVLNNLISNAIKFTDSGTITIRCALDEKCLRFEVQDTGIGIDKRKIALIFERFRQVDESNTRQFGGAGLGLAICKQLLRLMDGKIGVSSEEGIGSNFWFTVPAKFAATDEMKTIQKVAFPAKPSEKKGTKVLIVEDEYSNLELLRTVLSMKDIETVHAETGSEAIEIIKQDPAIKLIFMDVQLPEMNGFKASEYIKQISPELIIIAQTAISHEEFRVQNKTNAIDDVIYKPLKIDLVISKLNQYLVG